LYRIGNRCRSGIPRTYSVPGLRAIHDENSVARHLIQNDDSRYEFELYFLIYVIMLAAICLQLAWEGVALRDCPEVPRVSLDKNKSKS